MLASRRSAATLALCALFCACAATSAPAQDAAGLLNAVEALDARLSGALSAGERAAVHRDKGALVSKYFDGQTAGTTYARVFNGLDCMSTSVQRARNASARGAARRHAVKAKSCLGALVSALASAPASLRTDLGRIVRALAAISARVKAGRAFGAKATALRKQSAAFVKRHFNARPVGEVPFPEIFAALECVDVKVETGAVSGARSCARKLRRLLRENLPPSQGGTSPEPSGPPVTFGSDLTGEPVPISGVYPEDTEFWSAALSVPVAGMVTTFRVRTGSQPVALPIRFSIVRPQSDGRVRVVTTTDPPYQLPARSPGTYTFQASDLSFRCCATQKGDIVSIDNRGADQTQDPYYWFTRRPGFTTFSYTNPTPGAPTQDPGQYWTPKTHEGFDLLVQAVVAPS